MDIFREGDLGIMRHSSGNGYYLAFIDSHSGRDDWGRTETTVIWSHGLANGKKKYDTRAVNSSLKKIPKEDIKYINGYYYLKEKCDLLLRPNINNPLIVKTTYSPNGQLSITKKDIVSKVVDIAINRKHLEIYIIHKAKVTNDNTSHGINVKPHKVIIKLNSNKEKIKIGA